MVRRLIRPEIDILQEAWQDFAASADRLDLTAAEQGWTYDEAILLDVDLQVSPEAFDAFTAELASRLRCRSRLRSAFGQHFVKPDDYYGSASWLPKTTVDRARRLVPFAVVVRPNWRHRVD